MELNWTELNWIRICADNCTQSITGLCDARRLCCFPRHRCAVGYLVVLPRYLQIQFDVKPSTSSIAVGLFILHIFVNWKMEKWKELFCCKVVPYLIASFDCPVTVWPWRLSAVVRRTLFAACGIPTTHDCRGLCRHVLPGLPHFPFPQLQRRRIRSWTPDYRPTIKVGSTNEQKKDITVPSRPQRDAFQTHPYLTPHPGPKWFKTDHYIPLSINQSSKPAQWRVRQ